MGLEALKLVERRERRVLIVQVHDEADHHAVLAVVIQERAAAGRAIERPAERMLDQAGTMMVRLDLPQLLQADPVFLRLAVGVQIELLHQRLGQRAARALGEQGVAPFQLHAACEIGGGLLVLADAHIAGRDADHCAGFVVEHLARGEPGIDVDAQRLRARRQKLRDIGQRADEVAVVAHQLRHQHGRQPDRAGLAEIIEAVLAHLRLQRALGVLAPIGQQLVERGRVHHHAGQDVRADFGAFLDHHD